MILVLDRRVFLWRKGRRVRGHDIIRRGVGIGEYDGVRIIMGVSESWGYLFARGRGERVFGYLGGLHGEIVVYLHSLNLGILSYVGTWEV